MEFSLKGYGILRSKWLPIRNTSLFSATKSKYFQGLGGKHKPIKARSLLFATHGKCFQGTYNRKLTLNKGQFAFPSKVVLFEQECDDKPPEQLAVAACQRNGRWSKAPFRLFAVVALMVSVETWTGLDLDAARGRSPLTMMVR
ncbi:hypothetical protein HPB47_010006 [Ixodes persulcatus]|uniref:Uncharacterized protein n=1 Tax=Ixodes persulcatus TaxID=34615 RepID=A0AC60P104_IXOPE|nr:hypothetical protein HPB47_010006 [Ixodes persulcatus]